MKGMNNILLYTTDGNDEELREVFEDYLSEEGLTEDNISFEEWKEDELDIEWNDFISNIENSKDNTKCVILGTLGLWDGKHDIEPFVCSDLVSAIRKCVGSCTSVEITYKCGYMNVSASHHDGTNEYSIHLLNSKGCRLVNGDFSNPIYHKKIKDM